MSEPTQHEAASEARRTSIDKAVNGAMLLAFYGYLNRDQETVDIANVGLRAAGYPLLRAVND